MATTNLISKSLGDILTESGNGSPDHTSPKGSLYTDKDSALLYQNLNGTNTWILLNSVAYGYGYYNDNQSTTSVSGGAWVEVNNSFTGSTSDNVGFSANTNSLVLLNGYDGVYEINNSCTIEYSNAATSYEVGVSLDDAAPVSGSYNGNEVDATYITANINSTFIETLTGGTSIKLYVRDLNAGTNNVIITNSQLSARKIG